MSELSDLILQSGAGAGACVHGMSPWNVHVPDNATAWMLRLGFPRNGIHVQGIVNDRLRGRSVELEVGTKHGDAVDVPESNGIDWCQSPS